MGTNASPTANPAVERKNTNDPPLRMVRCHFGAVAALLLASGIEADLISMKRTSGGACGVVRAHFTGSQ
ncbi:hypothetical protein [Pilimelia anulata]|uniref:hypothetical protein n=1 Tax=Pilimelia anulata TaxID=53371 RepID=UPI0016646BCD|nr:hypothetical protein [Pilimelia anulata]